MEISPAFSRQARLALCLTAALACAPLARADEAAAPPAPLAAPAQPTEESTPAVPVIVGSLYATTAFGLSAVDGIPPGFDASAYDLPIIVGAEATVHGSRTGLDAWADLHGGTQTYGFDPLWGGAFGLGFQAQLPHGTLAARVGLAIEDQATLNRAPVGGSYLGIWRWGFVARAETVSTGTDSIEFDITSYFKNLILANGQGIHYGFLLETVGGATLPAVTLHSTQYEEIDTRPRLVSTYVGTCTDDSSFRLRRRTTILGRTHKVTDEIL